ncbi:hypothetical protein TDB9533_01818 [Thalassocella blandensis]|nr:hypothetical protein TDB9533_01818 [Thalassocella blandensis]
MQCYQKLYLSVFTVTIACIAGLAQADSGVTRYVAQDGEDLGRCENMFRPCRNLAYAVQNSTKVDRIYVAAGEYTLANADQVYSVGSAAFRIVGGYSRVSGFSERDPSRYVSTVVGLPPLYRDAFQQAGFKVIADQKGMSRAESQAVQQKMQKVSRTMQNHNASECINNTTQGFDCELLDLYAHLSLSSLKANATSGNDIWGYYDLNRGKEYVLIGLDNGVAIVDASNPEQPQVVAETDGPNSLWRDIKVYQSYDAASQRWLAYAYVSNETGDGIAIIDLNQLPNSAEVVARGGGVSSAHNVYLANVDFTFAVNQPGLQALLSIAGANAGGGNFRLYDLVNPQSPNFVAANNYGYMHDAASVRIHDDRKNTQCENASEAVACQVLADFNENTVEIFDITNASSPQHLSSFEYTNSAYVHSGWWTEDGKFLFVQDELDETHNGLNTTLRIWNMEDLNNPQYLGNWTGEKRAIDHNGFVKGNRYYMSHYTEGLTVLDITDPSQTQRKAYFDTVPGVSAANFSGAWGIYPFFVSDLLAVSDINSGLYLLKDKSLASAQGAIGFSLAHDSATEGSNLEVNVARVGGSEGNVSVQVALVPLTADDTDILFASGEAMTSLTWADGDTEIKTLMIPVVADGEVEGLERFALRLESPTSGATVAGNRITMLAISEADTMASLSFLNSTTTVASGSESATVSVLRNANIQMPVSAQLVATYPDGSAFTTQRFDLEWAAGDVSSKNIVVPIADANIVADATITLALENLSNANQNTDTAASIVVGSGGVEPTPPPGGSSSSSGGSNGGDSGGGGAAWHLLVALMSLYSYLLCQKSKCTFRLLP